jgi:hypothetical protein
MSNLKKILLYVTVLAVLFSFQLVGAQYDDYFERQDLGQIIYFGIDSMDPAVQAQIKALRNSGKIVHLYSTLLSNVPDYIGSQIQVDRIEVEE